MRSVTINFVICHQSLSSVGEENLSEGYWKVIFTRSSQRCKEGLRTLEMSVVM